MVLSNLPLRLFRFQSEERIAKDLEQSGLALPASAPESVNWRTYIDLDEPAFFQQTPPACTRQATGNSVGPQIDVADGRFRYNLAGGDIGELQPSTGAQHSHNLVEDTTLVDAEVDDPVADDDIGPTVLDRQFLDDPLSELDMAEAQRRRRCTGAFQHLVGHVDADDAPLGADLSGGDEAVETAARPEIDHPLPGMQCPLRERIAYTRKSLNGALRHSGDDGLVVAQSSRQRSSGVEVEAAAWIDGDIPILGPDFIAERHRINW